LQERHGIDHVTLQPEITDLIDEGSHSS